MTTELSRMTLSEVSALVANGECSPSDYIESCLQQIEQCEPNVRAWAHVDPDQARLAARLLDPVKPSHPLHGVPFGVKDIIDVADMPCRNGTPIYHNHQSARDAACVALLKEAGAVCIGKAVTTELAHFHPGKTRNPAALTHTPGGSSSGSAAAVAAHMVPFALGTQTTGSVLRPASYCGVYGFKPSYGDVIRSGVFECASSFDTVGWFARCVEDLEMVRQSLLRAPLQQLPSAALDELRVGVFRGPYWHQADECTRDSIDQAADQLSSKVSLIDEVKSWDGFDEIAAHHRVISGYEFARAISWERTQRGNQLSPKLLHGRCEDGIQASYEQFAAAQAALLVQRQQCDQVMQQFDLLLTPAAPGEAWPGLAATGDPVFNAAWTALHVPALSAPLFSGANGLPVGLQMVGRFRHDRQLLAGAAALCRVLEESAVS